MSTGIYRPRQAVQRITSNAGNRMFVAGGKRVGPPVKPPPTSTDTDAQNWITRAYSNGGTVKQATADAVSAFCVAAKAHAYWAKIYRINLFCGTGLAACLVPLKVGAGANATEMNFNFVEADYSEATGLTGNGSTKGLRTGVSPSTHLGTNNVHLAVYNRSATDVGGNRSMGSFISSAACCVLLAPQPGNNYYWDCYDQTVAPGGGRTFATPGPAAPYGFIVASRTSSPTEGRLYRAGVTFGTASAVSSGSAPNFDIAVFGQSQAASPAAPVGLTSHPLAAYSIGAGLTAAEVASFSTDMQAFQTALGRAV